MMTERIEDVLEYWFGHGLDNEKWFGGSEEVDLHIREVFAHDLQAAREGKLDAWAHSARGRLALVILHDQFARNIHRDQPECYSHDHVSQKLAIDGIENGHMAQLGTLERVFLYMPLMHAEDVALQDRCVALFEELQAGAPEDLRDACANFTKYAIMHRDTVAKFGRFPHRNPILGRTSTPEEVEFLTKGRFGE
jgi:uncharacterized protein (DUF924 family)